MKTRFITKKIKGIILLCIIIGMTSVSLTLPLFSSISEINNNVIGKGIKDEENLIYTDEEIPTTAEYQNYEGIGKNLNITLHQSLLDTTTKQFTDLDSSNSFTEPFPRFAGYNTSFVNISVNNIDAPNKTLNLELGTSQSDQTLTDLFAYSFQVRTTCKIQNYSIYLSESGGSGGDVDIKFLIYNATYDSGDSRTEPDSNTGLIDITQTVPDEDTGQWYNFTINKELDTSKTYNNTFFIFFYQNTNPTIARGYYHYESGSTTDEYLVYRDSGAGWQALARDISSQIIVGLDDNTPIPSDINLSINGTSVTDLGATNQGYWDSTQRFEGYNGNLDFEITADWWEVSCDITSVQINYTKSDLSCYSEFLIPASGQDVRWNVTNSGGLNYFDSRITDFNTINYTIPRVWNQGSIRVFNGAVEQTQINKRLLDASYREVQVINAGNGTFWYLNATSSNLISSIDTYVNGSPLIEANYTNILRFNASFSEIISDGNLNLSVYSPIPRTLNHSSVFPISTTGDEIFISNWDISDNVTDYGVFKAQLTWNNDTAAGYLELLFTVVANTDFILDSPQSGIDRFDNELFDIIVFFNDTGPNLGDIGITGATVTENSTLLGAPIPTGTDGYYSLQCDVSLFSYGWVYIEINASKIFYHNQSLIFSFHHRINTTISPSNTYNFGEIVRGDPAPYTFNYSDVDGGAVLGAIINNVSLPSGFVSNSGPVGGAPGNYTIELDTSNVQASVSPYTCIFNITDTGKQTQIITLIITVTQAQTSLTINSYIGTLNRKDGFDQQIEFYFNDTDNDQGVSGVTLGDISVVDNQTGSSRSINSLSPFGATGNYRLNISISGLNSGWIQFNVNVSRDPDYNWSIAAFSFYLRGNLTITSIESIRDEGGQGLLIPDANNYSIYIGLNININFTILDTDFGNNIVTGDANSYTVAYYQLSNPTNQGIISNALDFDLNTESFKGIISTSNLALGTYAINITILKTNYEFSTVVFNLTIKPKILVNISIVERPDQVNAGGSVNITLKVDYFNGTIWKALTGVSITIIPNFNGVNGTTTASIDTNINGTVTFTEITVGSTVTTMILYAVLDPAYNHTGFTRAISDIIVIPPTSTFEEILPYLIIGAIILLAVVGAVGIYRGVVIPKRREKQRVLTEVKTIFDDAINLEHILVLYKATGTCIFFKSYGSEEIDPELISGFLTAVSSFGKEMVAQEALNEISYGDKMLLLADGEYVRVALVLGKKGSLILRSHLKQFIDRFEQVYRDVLPSWRGQLAYFRNAGEIVDDILNTSIILPHQISYDFSNVKDLKNPHSKDVLKVAHACCEETERQFFFIATLLQEASESTNKDTAEIFMGIKELRDKRILMPIEISAIEAVPISQQEINLINQKVAQLANLSPEEKQKLVNDLAQLGPAEREAYLSSLSESKKIVSAPIKTTIGTVEVADKKSAKKEMKNLIKAAKSAKSEGEYSKSVDSMRTAAMLASNWDFPSEFNKIQEQIRKIQIEDLKIKMKKAEKAAKLAVKQKIYSEAASNYKIASKIASEIFKLGDPSMTKEVKRLTNKANEYVKLS